MKPSATLTFNKEIEREVTIGGFKTTLAIAFFSATVCEAQLLLNVQILVSEENFLPYQQEVEQELRDFLDEIKEYQPNKVMSFMANL